MNLDHFGKTQHLFLTHTVFLLSVFFVERLTHWLSSKQSCPKTALASTEFIAKFKIKAEHDSQTPEEHERLEEQLEATNLSNGSDDSQGNANGQM